MFRTVTLVSAIALLAGCYGPPPATTSASADRDLAAATIFTQMALVGGAPGLIMLPLLMAIDVHAANSAMEQANSQATLAQTYQFVYDRDLGRVGDSGSTGQVFRDMKGATMHFRELLRGHGVAFPQNFVLVKVGTADSKGYTLYALVHRPAQTIRIRDAAGRIFTLTERDDAFYRPYRTDINGQLLDVPIDWAGVPRTTIATQKGQALLMTLAANSVLLNAKADEFWSIEKRWRQGDYRRIVAERQAEIERRMASR